MEVPLGTAPGAAELQALKFASSDDVAAFMTTRLWFDSARNVPVAAPVVPVAELATASKAVAP